MLQQALAAVCMEVLVHLSPEVRLGLRVRRLSPQEALEHGLLLQAVLSAVAPQETELDGIAEAEAAAVSKETRVGQARVWLERAQGLAMEVVSEGRMLRRGEDEGGAEIWRAEPWRPVRLVATDAEAGEEGEEGEVRLPLRVITGEDLQWIALAALSPSREVADRLRRFPVR